MYIWMTYGGLWHCAEESRAGDRIIPTGAPGDLPAPPKQLKSQLWRDVLQGLEVLHGAATYRQGVSALALSRGCSLQALSDGV